MITSYSFLRVAGLCADESACGYYRVMNPLQVLNRLGANTAVYSVVAAQQLMNYDIIVAQRQVSPNILKILRNLAEAGKTIIFEIDDLMDKIDPNQPAYKHYHTGSADLNGLKSIMEMSHGITVSTYELYADSLKYSKNVHILPNMIDFSLRSWEIKPFNDTTSIKIGWTGSKSHTIDLDILGEVLAKVLNKYPNVIYKHFALPEMAEYLIRTYSLPVDRVELVDLRPFPEYPSGLLDFDIGLAPIVNNAFNRAKSNLKPLEYNACGIPFVASKVAPYQRYCKQGINGFTADSTAEWVEKLSILIEDTSLRKAIGDYGAAETRELYDLDKNIHLWSEAWSSVRFAHLTGDIGPGVMLSSTPKRNDRCLCGSGLKYKACSCYPAYGT